MFAGKLHLNSSGATKVYINYKLEVVTEFMKRIGIETHHTPTKIVEEYNAKDELELWTIADILEYISSGVNQEKEVVCRAAITDISNRNGWKYLSCATCSKKLGKSETSLICNNCNKSSSIGVARFRVELIVGYGERTTTFVLFDQDTKKITNTTAEDIIESKAAIAGGVSHLQAACAQKKYPRPFVPTTTTDKEGYLIYRRRDDVGKYIMKGASRLDNRYVIPHNMPLLKKYKAHINVEWCNTSKAIKYLFKYITKGVDKSTIVFQNTSSRKQSASTTKVEINEIQKMPKLTVHLEEEQSVIVDEDEDLEDIISRMMVQDTIFTKWMETNVRYPIARTFMYIQLPIFFVWDKTSKTWSRRQRGSTLGRIVNISPAAGEKYYLRMMINYVKGCRSFDEIRTVAGITYKTYKESCFALGLLDGDKEWHQVMDVSSQWASAWQLQELFVVLLIYCEVVDPLKLWKNCWRSFAEDILHMQRRKLDFQGLNLDDDQIQQYVLNELEKLFSYNDKSLADYPDMPVPEKNILDHIKNSMITEEKNYKADEK